MTQFYAPGTDPSAVEFNTDDACAAAWATYKQALHDVIDLDPVRLHGEAHDHPMTVLDEAAIALMNAGWNTGIQAERARAANIGFVIPERVCRRCEGVGRLWDDRQTRHIGAEETMCPECEGEGTIGTVGVG